MCLEEFGKEVEQGAFTEVESHSCWWRFCSWCSCGLRKTIQPGSGNVSSDSCCRCRPFDRCRLNIVQTVGKSKRKDQIICSPNPQTLLSRERPHCLYCYCLLQCAVICDLLVQLNVSKRNHNNAIILEQCNIKCRICQFTIYSVFWHIGFAERVVPTGSFGEITRSIHLNELDFPMCAILFALYHSFCDHNLLSITHMDRSSRLIHNIDTSTQNNRTHTSNIYIARIT